MFTFLYKNPGNKIKFVAKVIFICGIIASLVFAVILSTDRYEIYDLWSFLDVILFAVLNFWKFNGILFGGIISSYIFTLVLYAYGDKVENIQVLSDKNTIYE